MYIDNDCLINVEFDDLENGVLNIPKGVKVVNIRACSCLKDLVEVNMPNTVVKIADECFAYCNNLKKIKLSNKLEAIGTRAFFGCESLTSITIPSSVNYMRPNVFAVCKRLKDVTFLTKKLQAIPEGTFADCASLETIKLPSSIRYIGQEAFLGDKKLKNVTFSKKLYMIDKRAFKGCTSLQNITLPKSLVNIAKSAFRLCDLREVVLPNNVQWLGDDCFADNSRLKRVVLPNSLDRIGTMIFLNDTALTDVVLPKKMDRIPYGMFANCTALSKIDIPNSVVDIGGRAFFGCLSLQNIVVPDKVLSVGAQTFFNCKNLVSVKLSDKIARLDRAVFYSCYRLQNINMPKALEKIEDSVFYGCVRLQNIELNDRIVSIGRHAFKKCASLKSIHLPNKIKRIEEETFYGCQSLNTIDIPDSVTDIGSRAFFGCTLLMSVQMSENIENIGGDAFSQCDHLECLEIPTSIQKIGQEALPFNKITKNADRYYLYGNIYHDDDKTNISYIQDLVDSKDSDTLVLKTKNEIDSIPVILACWDQKDKVIKDISDSNVCMMYDYLYGRFDNDKFYDFVKNANNTFFKNLFISDKFLLPTDKIGLVKLFYDLGGFVYSVDDTHISKRGNLQKSHINYSQKVGEFLRQMIDKDILKIGTLYNACKAMRLDGFKKDFSDFFMQEDNLVALLQEEASAPGFIARCYNDFEKVQATNSSNRGSQRQLKPTIKKFISYFVNNRYEGVTRDSRAIANILSKYDVNQEHFNLAVQIDHERKEKHIPDDIIDMDKKENTFAMIDSYQEQITDKVQSTLSTLVDLAENFSYDWLKKSDPTNFILGKLCNCCAHISGAGLGIMKASIVHPDVQNMVIKNKDGEIIAKATLYVNRKGGYGVFNTVEVGNKAQQYKKEIYKTFKQGVKDFAKRYNEANPTNKIKIISVGMKNNDIYNEIVDNDMERIDLKAIDYGTFGIGLQNYSGDSKGNQRVVYREEDSKYDHLSK